MNRSFKVCLYCPTNLDIDKFQDSTEILPTWGCLSVVFPLGLVNLKNKTKQNKNKNKTKQNKKAEKNKHKNKQTNKKLLSKLPIFNHCDAHYFVGKIIYWAGNFGQWAG